MILVVILTVHQAFIDEFRAYERRAIQIMREHGGEVERTVWIPSQDSHLSFKEVHILRFPDVPAFTAYKSDARLLELAPLREKYVVATEVLQGEDGPDYNG